MIDKEKAKVMLIMAATLCLLVVAGYFAVKATLPVAYKVNPCAGMFQACKAEYPTLSCYYSEVKGHDITGGKQSFTLNSSIPINFGNLTG